MREGGRAARQVADRFHLFQNGAAAFQEAFSAHPHEIETLNEANQSEPLTLDDGSVAVPVAPPVRTGKSQQTIAHNRARRLAEYAQVRDFSQQGWTMKAIAAQVGRNRRTVKKYMQASTFPERQPRRRRHPTLLDP